MYTETETRLPMENGASLQQDAQRFMQHTCDIINAGAQAIMISIGHRSRLFDVMAQLPPATSQQIADQAGLAERFVREWLAVMVTARIIDYAPQEQTYCLPPAHAACLTRGARLGNAAVFAQHVAMMGALQDQTLQCLKSGSGTHYGDYPCFHQIMAEDSEMSVVNSLFDTVLPLIDGIGTRLESGIDVLDAGCGKGLALIAMAQHYPQSRFTGYDLCADAVAEAACSAQVRGLRNIRFVARDMTDFDEPGRYDLITSFDAVHDQRDPSDFIARIQRALKPDGVYLMQDIGGSAHLEANLDFPMASLLYAISLTHCTPISIGQGGKGLGAMWGWETGQTMLEQAGFSHIVANFLEHDPMNVWFISTKGPSHAR
ncbi:class I SAM-dependent methyltransferase [Marinobacterium sedimentorum]|uniref:class I SAM-dependent methyltransferase n=1 Tax=Marinobacterium sedimentorum TaxID=2927804 RepID=UPI0020C68A9C|nr:class I SAM-dependent methyltransferase [Marinobacterium sedimentorum]MCP8687543.1 class I SAM-dependent methyltransferase [Marinobacterium sedimentorum]